MQNYRKKGRIANLALVFMLVFLGGVAFAFLPGALDVVGTVNITAPERLYVVWESAEHGEDLFTALTTSWRADGDATIIAARNRTAQRIVWDIEFMAPSDTIPGAMPGPGDQSEAFLTASARNRSFDQDATITRVGYSWHQAGAIADDPAAARPATLNPADFGLSVQIMDANFVGLLEAGEVSDELFVIVSWNGTIPTGFFADADPGEAVFAATLVIDFDYAPTVTP